MGKKNAKRKIRWTSLSVCALPGEDTEEDGIRNVSGKGQENGTRAVYTFDRSVQCSGYKPRRTSASTTGTSGYASGGASSRSSHRDESASGVRGDGDSPGQSKIIFNEDEYTKVTTPRQDILFKKGYLSRKKASTSNASTSATPSTTESQSASHSTADGSETTEDQQLLDRDSGAREYAPVAESGRQLGYGTFYDHNSGYYYEYPIMLVGPAPVPAQIGPSILAAVPCGPVPLRPIEWVNPAFVPELSGQPYCLMNYQSGQSMEAPAPLVDEQGIVVPPIQNSNETWNESCTGSASCNGSVAEENEDQAEKASLTKEEEVTEEHPTKEFQEAGQQHLEENDINGGSYFEPITMQQPVHLSHVVPAVPQPYMYPGHYMFGPPLVNVNGVTIQSGPMIRTTDVAAIPPVCTKRRRKRKKRKQRRLALGNAEDEEEEESYSSEGENGLSSSRLPPWPVSTTTPDANAATITNRPLNPECEEFQLRPIIEPDNLSVVPASVDSASTSEDMLVTDQTSHLNTSTDITSASKDVHSKHNGIVIGTTTIEKQDTSEDDSNQLLTEEVTSVTPNCEPRSLNDALTRLTSNLVEDEKTSTNEVIGATRNAQTDHEALEKTDVEEVVNHSFGANEKYERSNNDVSIALPKECKEASLSNGKVFYDQHNDTKDLDTCVKSIVKSRSADEISVSKKLQSLSSTLPTNTNPIVVVCVESQEVLQNCEVTNSKALSVLTKKKSNSKGSKFVREPTPGPDLVSIDDLDVEKITISEVTKDRDNVETSETLITNLQSTVTSEKSLKTNDEALNEDTLETSNDNVDGKSVNDKATEGSNDDSGIETQTRCTQYPITEAVRQWLRTANSPDIFITSTLSSDSETDEDEDELEEKPPKNLQGNPMSALSANSSDDSLTLSCTANRGEFASVNNVMENEAHNHGISAVEKRKRNAKNSKKRAKGRIARRAVNTNDNNTPKNLISSSDSNQHRKESTTIKRKNSLKQNVNEICEFTEKDSVAGMRVATNSRIGSKRVNIRRVGILEKLDQDSVENINVKMRRKTDAENNDDGIIEDTMSVKTFEKGEIVVSVDGKFLPVSSFQPFLQSRDTISDCGMITEKIADNSKDVAQRCERETRSCSIEDDTNSIIASFTSIEEPDVLECWEAETVEPVITPKRMLQTHGIMYEGEAVEEDSLEAEAAIVEHVQKYYRLARESATSVEEEPSEIKTNLSNSDMSKSRTVPNSPAQIIEHFCEEEIPVALPSESHGKIMNEQKLPIDEAFEVYESYYTGKTPFMKLNSTIFKPHSLYGQEGEGPIPCRAVCCNIQ